MKTRIRRLIQALLAAGLIAGAAPVVAVDDAAQYQRWRDTAQAFADQLNVLVGRYPALRDADVKTVQAELAAADQAAGRQDYAGASRQARLAYEHLRTLVTGAVAQGRTAP